MFILSKIQKVEKLSPGLKALYFHKIIRDVGIGVIGVFGPIFLYTLTKDVRFVFVYHGLISLCYILFLPLTGKTLKHYSMNWFLTAGTAGLMFYLAGYFSLAKIGQPVLWLMFSLIVLGAGFKFFYWVPYHVDFARFVNKHHRGRQLSFLAITVSLIGIILPFFAGWVIGSFGFGILFLIALIVLGISLIPVKLIPRVREQYLFSYQQTLAKLFSKKHFKTNLAYFADGFQEQIGYIVWPIFIFLLLKGEYFQVGAISAIVILASSVLRFLIGEVTDKFDKKKLIKIGSFLYFLGWIFKSLVETVWHVFLAGTFHNLSAILLRTPLDATTFEIAADEGHYVDEFTVFKEMSLHAGKFLSAVISILLLFTISLQWLFFLSAVMSILVNLISKEEFYLARRAA